MDSPIKKFFRLKQGVSLRPTYASKDYVEHLRTVHFALTTISAALLLILLSAKPYDSQKAIIQIEQILKLKKVWSLEWIWENHLRSTSSPRFEFSNKPLIPLDPIRQIPTTSNGAKKIDLPDFGEEDQTLFVAKIHEPAITTEPRSIHISFPPTKEWLDVKGDEEVGNFPETLRGITAWWNNLRSNPSIISRPAAIATTCSNPIQRLRARKVFCVMNRGIARANDLSSTKILKARFIRITNVIDNGSGISSSEHTSLEFPSRDQQDADLSVPVLMREETTVSQQDARVMFPEWRRGDFATTFPDLFRAAQGLDSFELEDMAKHLSTDTRATEVFEAFGLKIPAQQATVWGTVIIIFVHLYLFVYLKSLKNPLQPSDPSWEVGWIAMNEAILPRCMLFTTVFVLPVMAVILLTAYDFDQVMGQAGLQWEWTFASVKKLLGLIIQSKHTALFILGCILTSVLGYLNWHNRPRLATEQQVQLAQTAKAEQG
jgi:hypothetical protein